MVHSDDDRILIESLYKFKNKKNYSVKNLFENSSAKVGWFLVWISCKEN